MGRKKGMGSAPLATGIALASLANIFAVTPSMAQDSACVAGCASSIDDIIVTATRRDSSVISVPLSVVASDRERLDRDRVTNIADLARTTPGLSIRNGWGDSTKISIRGIASSVGTATTGIYIDDTPIQVRSLGAADIVANVYPEVFDLERIEVLRGPQGTLFGAGSEGGTVRFITAAPSLDDMRLYGKASASSTKKGAASWSAGASISAPLVNDRVGISLSAFTKKDGGWLDRVPLEGGGVAAGKDVNRRTATSLRAAVAFQPMENLTITPGIFYQRTRRNDTDQYWELLSNPSADQYVSGAPVQEPARDRFYLPTVKGELELGSVRLITNTSWFDREKLSVTDYSYHTIEGTSYILSNFFVDNPSLTIHNLLPSAYTAPSNFVSIQKSFTQEARLQSADPDAALSWTIGGFYQNSRQQTQQRIVAPLFPDFMLGFIGVPVDVFFAPGGMLSDGVLYASSDSAKDTQLAAFGQIDWKATDKLTFTVGGRLARTKFSFDNSQDGAPNFGPSTSSGSAKQTPLTPKFGVSYEPVEASLVYASAARGFRPGGGNTSVPALCGADLETLDLQQVPSTYESDRVWSYEVGAKTASGDGRVNVQASAFLIDWNNIQQTVPLFQCGFSYTANLGKARSKGFDLQLAVEPLEGFVLRGSVAYTDAKYTRTVIGGSNNALLVTKGDELPGPPWQVRLSSAYDFEMGDDKAFVQLNYDYSSSYQRLPTAFSTDTTIMDAGATHFVSGRTGITIGNVQAALFVDNMLNSRDSLYRTRDSVASIYYRQIGFRPRTVGIELIFRN